MVTKGRVWGLPAEMIPDVVQVPSCNKFGHNWSTPCSFLWANTYWSPWIELTHLHDLQTVCSVSFQKKWLMSSALLVDKALVAKGSVTVEFELDLLVARVSIGGLSLAKGSWVAIQPMPATVLATRLGLCLPGTSRSMSSSNVSEWSWMLNSSPSSGSLYWAGGHWFLQTLGPTTGARSGIVELMDGPNGPGRPHGGVGTGAAEGPWPQWQCCDGCMGEKRLLSANTEWRCQRWFSWSRSMEGKKERKKKQAFINNDSRACTQWHTRPPGCW